MKRFIFITMTVLFILGMGGWSLWAQSRTPSAVFMEFHNLIRDGNTRDSWEYLSHDTKEEIVNDVSSIFANLTKLAELEGYPQIKEVISGILCQMHLQDYAGDHDGWKAMLTEAKETGRAAYLSPKLEVTGEEIKDNKAIVHIQHGSVTGEVEMVYEDGMWKVAKPYIIQLAVAGWTVDVAMLSLLLYLPGRENSTVSYKSKPGLNIPIWVTKEKPFTQMISI